jgi:hypothetical protein
MDLNLFWFIMLGVLLAGYAVLDGFDLGVGILHLVVRKDEERRLFMNSIGPIWDGNEVWLVTFGGALFAAFPEVYATVFSGFYTAFMALLFALIFRAVSMEFRSKRTEPRWRAFWDASFFAGVPWRRSCMAWQSGTRCEACQSVQTKNFEAAPWTCCIPTPCSSGCLRSPHSRCTGQSIFT